MNMKSKILNTIISGDKMNPADAPKDGTWIYASLGTQNRIVAVMWDADDSAWIASIFFSWDDCLMNYWYVIP